MTVSRDSHIQIDDFLPVSSLLVQSERHGLLPGCRGGQREAGTGHRHRRLHQNLHVVSGSWPSLRFDADK